MKTNTTHKERLKNIETKKDSLGKKEQGNRDIVDSVRGNIEGADTQFEVGAVMSENLSEDRQKVGDSKFPTGNQQDNKQDEIRASLQRDPQKLTKKAVRYFLKRAAHKEIKEVQKEVHQLSKDVIGNAFELSEALKKLKKLKLILKNIAHWTADFLREIFTRLKNGKKIADEVLPQE